MLVGHFAVGLAAKRMEPAISVGTLVLASMLADFLWCILLLAGIEHVQFQPGIGAANYIAASDIAISHSLLTDGLWAALLAAVYFLRRRSLRGAWVIFGAVLSHWVLDWISHRPDMPLSPGGHTYFGLGLWSSIPAAVIVEGGFWGLALVVYARATRPKNRMGVYAYWSIAALLTLAWYNNLAGPPPRNPRTAPVASLVFFSLAVAWAYWMNRLRPGRVHPRNLDQTNHFPSPPGNPSDPSAPPGAPA
ncbi:MAG TPA: metal-dependent hydrolase [Bryobacteraceae bacterium]|nr:metal-dependent hydrolase [Bryobacteraceae bacterium]